MSDEGKQEISLLDSCDGEWLRLPLTIMQDVGPAVQTMAGMLKITNRETYVPVADIASKARLPAATVRKHLATLDRGGWVHNAGRERTRRGHLRRTATVKVTKNAIAAIKPYAVLPWWACCGIAKVGRLPWCARAVLSIILARLCGLKHAAEIDGPRDELEGEIDNMGGDDRFRFSLDSLTAQTGLTRESVVTAKRHLRKLGIVDWQERKRDDGGDEADVLAPNWDFRLVVTPARGGGCYLAFAVNR